MIEKLSRLISLAQKNNQIMRSLITNLSTTNITKNTLDRSLLFFRIGVALSLMIIHGLPKVFDFQTTMEKIPDPFGLGGEINAVIAVLANVLFAAFVAAGLFTRLSALFILSITLTGLFIVHANDPLAVKDVPYMYSLAFALIAILGAGKYSLDHYFFKSK
jgi:putative oxidoreductase